ncbi:MAG TPA: hypothetical protein VHS78_07935 [Candidatus Elarobacter sp.]|jgi:hypothetical protein|nr:hypothetical protein [Candidatus Elarobacter sp.]
MTTSETRALLAEGRALQRYAWGGGAPRFALRRYVRLLGAGAAPMAIPGRWARVPSLTALFEPLPLLPRSASSREFERRLYLATLVTELTPWGARRSRGWARRGFAEMALRAAAIGLAETLALPGRLVFHRVAWWPAKDGAR